MSTGQETRLSALDAVLDRQPAVDSLASDLFAVVDALDSSAALRRSLTDPSTPDAGRRSVVHSLLDGKVSTEAVNVVEEASATRWAGGRTFTAALERQAVRAELIRAESQGQLEDTEDGLFRFARLVESEGEVRNALSDRSVPLANRQTLVSELLNGKTNESTTRLAVRAVGARERTFGHTIEGYVTLAAAQKNRVVATVRTARPLDSEQLDRMRSALSRQAGREVFIQEIVDPSVLGGIRVELGDEVVEGTVAGRLHDARRLFG